jgi:hypothetical protein
MLRADGEFTIFCVQMRTSLEGGGTWVTVAPEVVLFRDLTFEEKQGPSGRDLRRLLKSMSASGDCWQTTGIADASFSEKAVELVARRCAEVAPGTTYRVAALRVSRVTTARQVITHPRAA